MSTFSRDSYVHVKFRNDLLSYVVCSRNLKAFVFEPQATLLRHQMSWGRLEIFIAFTCGFCFLQDVILKDPRRPDS